MTMTLAAGEATRVLLPASLPSARMMTLAVGAVHLHLHLLPLRLTTRVQLQMISLEMSGVEHVNDSIIGGMIKTAFRTLMAMIKYRSPSA
jgi:hypothetical protein